MAFCTVINCMDGRVQLPVITYLRRRCNVDYVDSITEPGPIKILAEGRDRARVDSIMSRLDLSMRCHGSRSVAVVAHHDCGGNPLPRTEQEKQLDRALASIRDRYPDLTVIGLWVDEDWQVEEIA